MGHPVEWMRESAVSKYCWSDSAEFHSELPVSQFKPQQAYTDILLKSGMWGSHLETIPVKKMCAYWKKSGWNRSKEKTFTITFMEMSYSCQCESVNSNFTTCHFKWGKYCLIQVHQVRHIIIYRWHQGLMFTVLITTSHITPAPFCSDILVKCQACRLFVSSCTPETDISKSTEAKATRLPKC
jgi:hypothetical protein